MRDKNVKHRPKYLLAVIFVTVLVMVMGLSGIASAADSGLSDVDKPTLKALRDKYNEVGNPPKGAATFSTPVDTANYTPATLSDDANEYAEKYINFMRFQAGIAPIELTEKLNNNAAQGALIMARNKLFSHNQTVPDGITEQAAKPGRYATKTSNISYMSSTSINGMSIVETAILGQMKDDDGSNLQRVGHRRWLMKPSTSTMGIGSALIDDDGWKTSYSAVRVMNRTYNEPLYDSSFGNIAENNSVNYDFVAWPSSGYMLNTVFDYNTPWSVSINEDKYKPFSDAVEVVVKRLSDNKTWSMNQASENTLNGNDNINSNYFKISNNSNSGYVGEGHCLIFCPNPNELGSSKLNDSFEVKITGLEKNNGDAVTLSYTVDFKGLKPSMNEMDITLESGSLEYTGQALKPKAIVSYDGTTLVEDEDYSIEYTNNVGVGNAAVAKIKGKGDYEGEVTKTFAITPKKVSLPIAKTGLVYSGAEQIGVSDSQEYTVANGSAENAGQYTATVSLKDKTNTVWIDESTTDKSIVWSISPKSLANATVELEEDEFEYDGSEKKPVATVKDEEKTLTEGTDYSVGYSDNEYVGNQAKVIVSAKEGGNYSGSVTKTFTIAPKTLTADMISITSDAAVYDGTDQTPAFKVMDGETELVKDTDYEVESDGKGKAAGNYDIKIKGKGNYSGSVTKAFTISKKLLTDTMVTLNNTEFTYNGQEQKPTVTVEDGELMTADDYQITNNGGTNAGDYKVTVSAKDNGNYSGSVEKSFKINPKDIADNSVTVTVAGGSTYNGSGQEPDVTVKDGDNSLTSNDFEVAYSDNITAGENAKVTITGKGNYTGTRIATFTIAKLPITEDVVNLSATEFTYNGQNQKPVVTVEGGDLMGENDYQITNNGGTNAGEYEVTVNATANGNYSGSITKKFTIAPKALTADMMSITSDAAVYDGTDQTPAFKVMDGETKLVKDTDYEVESDGKGKAAGNYDIKIKGKGNYSGSVTKAFTISKKPLADTMVTLNNTEFTYNGQEQKPTVTIVDGELMTTDDYQITYNGGTNAGDYKVTVSEKDNGNYSGSVEKSFKINPKDIADNSITLTVASGATYNGSEQKPDVTVKDGDNSLTNNDFELAYSNNITVGENAKVTITGKGNYTGSRTQTFSIAPASLTGATIVLKPIGNESIEMGDTTVYVQETENAEIKPEIDSVTVGDVELTADDYDVAYSNNTAPGKEAKVTITGKGNYKDKAEVTFTIVSKDEFEIEENINKLNGELDALTQAVETAKGNYKDAEEKAKASKAAADNAAATPGQAAVNAAQKAADDAAAVAEAARAVENALAELKSKIEEIQQRITAAGDNIVVLKDKIEQYAGDIQVLSEDTADEIATAKQNTEKAEQAKTSASNALEKAESDKAEADKKAAEGTTPGQNENTNQNDPKTGNTDKAAGEKADADDDDDDEDAATIAKINAAKAAKVKIKGKALKKLKVQLTWKKVKNVSGFEVYQSDKKKGKFKKLATIKKGTAVKWLSKEIKKGKKGKKVFFKVRAFTIVDGDKVYGKWSNVKAIKLKK